MYTTVGFPDCIAEHVHLGAHDGQEAGFECTSCHDEIMGHHKHYSCGKKIRKIEAKLIWNPFKKSTRKPDAQQNSIDELAKNLQTEHFQIVASRYTCQRIENHLLKLKAEADMIAHLTNNSNSRCNP